MGNLEESNAVLERLLARLPDQIEVRSLLALNQQQLGDNASAVKNLRGLLERDPTNAAAHLNLAISYSRLDRLDDAIRELQAALTISSKAGSPLEHVTIPAEETLGGIRLRRKEYDAAAAQFRHLLTLAPQNYEAHFNLAWLAGQSGHLDEAIAHLQSAIKADPASAAAHNALGSIYLQQKDLERAGSEFREAVRLDPRLAFAHYNLALVLGSKGDRDGAAREFRESLKADPQLQPARDALKRMGL